MLRGLARNLLKAIPPDTLMPVMSGANRGKRWMIGAGNHACWLGTYERSDVDLFVDLLRPDDVVWDVGAHAGYFTLASASHVRHVVACEPDPRNAGRLRRHLAVNRIANATVIEAAIGDHEGQVSFGGGDSYQGKVGHGQHQVRATTLDTLIRAGGLPAPSVMKMDIEGNELRALRAGRAALKGARVVLLGFHSDELREQCRDLLTEAGFAVTLLNVATLLARR
jgi:FkbM family methyltransferase